MRLDPVYLKSPPNNKCQLCTCQYTDLGFSRSLFYCMLHYCFTFLFSHFQPSETQRTVIDKGVIKTIYSAPSAVFKEEFVVVLVKSVEDAADSEPLCAQ